MMWWMIGIGVGTACVVVLVLGLCRAASHADDMMEKIMEDERNKRC